MSSNNGYKIYKKYTMSDVRSNIITGLPDKLLYHPVDYLDSYRRMSILHQLIDRDGCKCQCCGEVPEFFAVGKDNLHRFHMDLYSYCNDEMILYTIDHINPKCNGGKNVLENYQMLCKRCNQKKADFIPEKFEKQVDKIYYIDRKVDSLLTQVNKVFDMFKHTDFYCINYHGGFTINSKYRIVDFNIFYKNDNVEMKLYALDDNNNVTEIDKNSFVLFSEIKNNNEDEKRFN